MKIRGLYQKIKKSFRSSGLVLMYHRIATPKTDPWHLAVSPDNFAQHLKVLRSSYNVIPLSQLTQHIQKKTLKRKSVAITFDDGYMDNYLTAKPLLENYDLPATFFITTANLGMKKEFWWDELEKIILHTQVLPQALDFSISHFPFSFNLQDQHVLTNELEKLHQNYDAYEPKTLRAELYFKLWEKLGVLTAKEQEIVIQQIREWASTTDSARDEYCCMSLSQLKDLSSNGLFELGGHTKTHPALAYHNNNYQLQEIRSNKEFLEELTAKEINLFAYPSGNYNEQSIEIIKKEKFKAAFSTNYGCILPGHDLYTLNRLQVNNWGSEKFKQVVTYSL